MNPKNNPSRASTYWCSAKGCFADRVNCKGACEKQKTVWCAVDDSGAFACARDRRDCLVESQRSRDRRAECVKQTAALEEAIEPVAPVVAPVVAPAPRGFYCAASSSNAVVGLCAREKADCAASRAVLVVATPDVSECALVESAWCYGRRCAPSGAACTAQRDAEIAAHTDSTLAECTGTR